MKTFRLIFPAVAAAAFFSGCYTQFALVDKTPQPKEEVTWVVDSTTGDTVKVIKQTDTVHTQDNQTCIWERDLMGYPHLRCYDSFYPRDWYYYNYSPWWYYDYPYYSGGYYSGGYYYGGRRYGDRYHEGSRGPVKTEPSGPAGSSSYPRARGISDPKTSGGGTGSSSARSAVPAGNEKSATIESPSSGSGEIIIPAGNDNKPVIVHERSRGVSKPGGAVPVPAQSVAPAPAPSKTATVNQSAPPPPPTSTPQQQSAQPSTKSSPKQSSPPKNEGNASPRRRRPRSW
ncbi:MAG: hypothetical protein JW913_03380 [Chitinispirillaceae bacterium]|nr:hypothetical protein [Chitinispirillaceae bacterium]